MSEKTYKITYYYTGGDTTELTTLKDVNINKISFNTKQFLESSDGVSTLVNLSKVYAIRKEEV